jgi:hypothetical protein
VKERDLTPQSKSKNHADVKEKPEKLTSRQPRPRVSEGSKPKYTTKRSTQKRLT